MPHASSGLSGALRDLASGDDPRSASSAPPPAADEPLIAELAAHEPVAPATRPRPRRSPSPITRHHNSLKAAAIPAFRHRVVLSPNAELEGATADDSLGYILDSIEVPR